MLDPELIALADRLASQGIDENVRQKNVDARKAAADWAARGFSLPGGPLISALDELVVREMAERGRIAWASYRRALTAFKTEYSSQLADDLKVEVLKHLPNHLGDARDYFPEHRLPDPMLGMERRGDNLRNRLTAARSRVVTDIELHVRELHSTEPAQRSNGNHPPTRDVWYKRPAGDVALSVVKALLGAGALALAGWIATKLL